MTSKSSNKINIYFQNEQFLIWSAKDALKIRQKYRIVGCLIGPYPGEPYQVNKNGLPLQLMEEETRLLLDIGAANLIKFDLQITKQTVDEYNQHLDTTRKDYSRLATERRLREIESHIETVSPTKGQKRKRDLSKEQDQLSEEKSGQSDLNEINLQGERKSAIQTLNNDILPVQLFTECPWPRKEEVINDTWLYPQNKRDKLLYKIFKDLWNKNFYITSGFKFGCDYLVYEYDPLKFHSRYMVCCRSSKDDLTGLQLLILDRVSGNVNKELLFASLVNTSNATDKNYGTSHQDQDNDHCEPVYVRVEWQGDKNAPIMCSNMRPNLPN